MWLERARSTRSESDLTITVMRPPLPAPAARDALLRGQALNRSSVVDSVPSGVCVRVLVDVHRGQLRFDEQLELVVGALVADGYRDGVRGRPEKPHATPDVCSTARRFMLSLG
jgi:hypothetical protein